MAVSFLCAFPSLAFARVPCKVSPLLRILCGEQRRTALGVVAVLGLWLWSWSTSRCLWPFVRVRGVVPPLRGSSPLPTLGVVRAFALGFSPSPACFRAPQKGALDLRAPFPQADAGWLGAGWPWLVLARHKSGHRRAAHPRPQRTWAGAALLLRSSWFCSPLFSRRRLCLVVRPRSPLVSGPRRGATGFGMGWGGRGKAD